MTIQEQNKATVRRCLAEGDANGPGILDEVCGPGYRMFFPSSADPIGLEEHKALWQAWIDAFPDLQHTIHLAIAEGEWVATHETMRGTHRREFQGRVPTGREVALSAVCLFRFVDGKLVEYRADADLLGFFEQLGE